MLTLWQPACAFPIIARRFPKLPIPHQFLFLSRHFGTGVLIATAFVHLLPTAFISLTDPCLPAFWNEGYSAMAGLFAMVSMLVVVGIEMFFATKGAAHSHASEFGALPTNDGQMTSLKRPRQRTRGNSFRPFDERTASGVISRATDGSRRGSVVISEVSSGGGDAQQHGSSNINSMTPSSVADDSDASDLELEELDASSRVESGLLSGNRKRRLSDRSSAEQPNPHDHSSATHELTEQQRQQKLLLQCLLLEAGILFHSVFIGMAVSVATGTGFVVLLVAISFHQTFEGFALGSRIAAIDFPSRSPKPWLMALAYGITTPIGQAIGLIIHNLYDPASQAGLLLVGTMNAISSGLLLYAGLVNLLAEDFLSDHSYETLRGKRRIHACAAVVAGAALMALVGAWA